MKTAPTIKEEFEPGRITLTLPLSLSPTVGDKSAIKIGDKTEAKDSIIDYLTDHPEGKTADIAEYLGLKLSRTRDYLKELTDEGIIEAIGKNKNRKYRLKR